METELNPEMPGTDKTNEEVPDTEEPNNGINDGSKNEMNEQQKSEEIHQEIEEEAPGQTHSDNKGEEPSVNPDMESNIRSAMKDSPVSARKQSTRSAHFSQRSQQSIGRQSLSQMPLQLQSSNDGGADESVAWLSQRTGKEMKCKFNQTSVMWERKPLEEILHPSSKTPQISDDTEKDKVDEKEATVPAGDAEPERGAVQESVYTVQTLEGAEVQEGSPPTAKQEPKHGRPSEDSARHISLHTILSLPPEYRKLSQVQPPNEATTEGDISLISVKTGKEMKCSFNQTSCIWERKPLAEILYPPTAKTPSPEDDTIAPERSGIEQGSSEKVSASIPQLEEQESQDGNQQLEARESKQDGEWEAPETQTDLSEDLKDVLGPPEEARAESPEAAEALQVVSEEAPES